MSSSLRESPDSETRRGRRSHSTSSSSSSASSGSSSSRSSTLRTSASDEEEDSSSTSPSTSSSASTSPQVSPIENDARGSEFESGRTVVTLEEQQQQQQQGTATTPGSYERRLSSETASSGAPGNRGADSPPGSGGNGSSNGSVPASVTIFGVVDSSGSLLRSAASRKSLLKTSASSSSLSRLQRDEETNGEGTGNNNVVNDKDTAPIAPAGATFLSSDENQAQSYAAPELRTTPKSGSLHGTRIDFSSSSSAVAPSALVSSEIERENESLDSAQVETRRTNEPASSNEETTRSLDVAATETIKSSSEEEEGEVAVENDGETPINASTSTTTALTTNDSDATNAAPVVPPRRTSARTAAAHSAKLRGEGDKPTRLIVDDDVVGAANYLVSPRLASPRMGENGAGGGKPSSSRAAAAAAAVVVNRPNNVTGEWPRIGEAFQADIPPWDPTEADKRPSSSDTEVVVLPPDEPVSESPADLVVQQPIIIPAATPTTTSEEAKLERETSSAGVEITLSPSDAATVLEKDGVETITNDATNSSVPPMDVVAQPIVIRRPFPKIPYVESILPMESRANPIVRDWTPLEIAEFTRALYKDNDDFARIARTMNNRKTLNQQPGWIPETARRCANYFFTVFFSSPSFKPWQQAAMRREHRRNPIEFRNEDGSVNYNATSAYDSLLDISAEEEEALMKENNGGKRPRRNVSRTVPSWGNTSSTTQTNSNEADKSSNTKKRQRRHDDEESPNTSNKKRHHSHKHRDHENGPSSSATQGKPMVNANGEGNKKQSSTISSSAQRNKSKTGSNHHHHHHNEDNNSSGRDSPDQAKPWEDPVNEYIPSKVAEIPTAEDMRPLKTSACVCGRGSPSVLFIECGSCGAWLHAACMGLRKEMIDQDSVLRCEKCAKVGKALGIPGPELEHPTTWSVKHNRGEASRLVIVPLINTTRARLAVIPPQAAEELPHSKIWEQCSQESHMDYGGTAGRQAWASQPNAAEMENALLPIGIPSYVSDPPHEECRDYVLLLASRRVPVWDQTNSVLIAGAKAPRVCDLANYLKANPSHITYHGVVKRNPFTNLRGGVVQESHHLNHHATTSGATSSIGVQQQQQQQLQQQQQQQFLYQQQQQMQQQQIAAAQAAAAAQQQHDAAAAAAAQMHQQYLAQQQFVQAQQQQAQAVAAQAQQQHMFAIAQQQHEVAALHQSLLSMQQDLANAQAYLAHMSPAQQYQFQQQQQLYAQRQQQFMAAQQRLHQLQNMPSFQDAYANFVQQQMATENELALHEAQANADMQQRIAMVISEYQENMARIQAQESEHPEKSGEYQQMLKDYNTQLNNEVNGLRAMVEENLRAYRNQFQAALENHQNQLLMTYPEQMTQMLQHQMQQQQMHQQMMQQQQQQQQQMMQEQMQQQQQQQQQFQMLQQMQLQQQQQQLQQQQQQAFNPPPAGVGEAHDASEQHQQLGQALAAMASMSGLAGAGAAKVDAQPPSTLTPEQQRRALEMEYVRELDNLTFLNMVLHIQYDFHTKRFQSQPQDPEVVKEFNDAINILVLHARRIHANFLSESGLNEQQISEALKGHSGLTPLLLQNQLPLNLPTLDPGDRSLVLVPPAPSAEQATALATTTSSSISGETGEPSTSSSGIAKTEESSGEEAVVASGKVTVAGD